MKKNLILLIVGILIGVLAITQIVTFNNNKGNKETSTAPLEFESPKQNNVILQTVAYYVLSFVKHQ